MNLKAGGQTRRRGAALEQAILDAAWEVLAEQGYPGFTYEAVAARAGTSRPVLYRRWPQHEDLLLATVRRFWSSQPIELPDTGNLRADAIGFLRNADVGRTRMLTLLSVQITDYFRETGMSLGELRDTIGPADQPPPFDTILARAVERGELAEPPRSPRVASLPFDLYRHEVFLSMKPVPEDVIEEIVDEVWLPLLGVG
ncbi:TetR/AcrR family transcriptional regulator [Sciscionella sediminilitoris]|uniref:TetR/AcrR family transcriptional regulator n=1 Tax=Sciscionella sediminilitoris TaxID=1445613 RepID=UPI0004DF15CC|nr:TetR/AcrR family transcriptional regulator [Sciscionella sp. SE31]